jgi:hypothetical protein
MGRAQPPQQQQTHEVGAQRWQVQERYSLRLTNVMSLWLCFCAFRGLREADLLLLCDDQAGSCEHGWLQNTDKNQSGHFGYERLQQCVLWSSSLTCGVCRRFTRALPATAGGFQRWAHHTLDTRFMARCRGHRVGFYFSISFVQRNARDALSPSSQRP